MSAAKRVVFMLAAIAWMVAIFYVSSIPDLRSSLASPIDMLVRKGAHIFEFGVLFLLLSKSFTGMRSRSLIALTLSCIYAITDEWHHTFVPGRVGSVFDVGFDMLGIAIAYFLIKRRTPPVGNYPVGSARSEETDRPRETI